jgi:hypothetical protein
VPVEDVHELGPDFNVVAAFLAEGKDTPEGHILGGFPHPTEIV